MHTNLIIYLSTLSTLIACSTNIGEVNVSNGDLKIVTYSDVVSFPLDDDMAPSTKQIQVLEDDGRVALAVLNSYDSSIHVFDYDSKKEIEEIKCNKLLSGDRLNGFTFSGNSIYLYSYSAGILRKMNRDTGSMESMITIPDKKEKNLFLPAPYICTNSPIAVVEKKVILPGFLVTENRAENSQNRPILTICDMETGSVQYRVSYPKLYLKGNWGGGFYYRAPYTTMGHDGKLLISLGAADDLVRYDPVSDTTDEVPAKSVVIKSIKPYSPIKGLPPSADAESKWAKANASYQNIIYDREMERYYRFYRLPVSPDSHGRKPTCIIVFDKNMKKLGEVMIKKDYNLDASCVFVHNGGLHIRLVTDDEEELSFAFFDTNRLI